MPYHKHCRVQLVGTLSGLAANDEIWSNTINMSIGEAGGEWVHDPQEWVDRMAPHVATWYGLAANGLVATSRLVSVKANNINPDGSYADPTTHEHVFPTPVAGGAGNGQAPAFCSVAITWETQNSRGPGHRGRIYPPNYDYIPTGSTISPGDVALVVAAGKRLLDALIAEFDTDGNLVSPVVASKVGTGINVGIVGVSADDIYDVQRRRKNALPSVRNRQVWP